MRRGLVAAFVAAIIAAGCGGSSGRATRWRTAATRICLAAQRRLERITPPTLGPADRAFLQRGISVSILELRQLRRLHPPGALGSVYGTALSAIAQEIVQLQRAVSALARQSDPAVAYASLQRRLGPLESDANGAWTALEIPACVTR